jgi:hypothetical protein
MGAAWLVAGAALIVGVLGTLHLVYTFGGSRLHPRDESLITHMQAVSPRLTRQTTIWRAGLGFHASHSLGAMLFAAVFASLALAPGAPLFAMPVLAQRFWFRIPLLGPRGGERVVLERAGGGLDVRGLRGASLL